MICPNCNKEIENGSKFCTYCGNKIIKYEAPARPIRQVKTEIDEKQQTAGERLLLSVCRTLFYFSVFALILSGLSKILYVEDVQYGFEDSTGYYVYRETPVGDGECSVIIRMYPLLKIKGLSAGVESKHYLNTDEMSKQIDAQRQRVHSEYDENTNTLIICMVFAIIATFILYKYVNKLCKSN